MSPPFIIFFYSTEDDGDGACGNLEYTINSFKIKSLDLYPLCVYGGASGGAAC
jgi:hypothetical protein